MTNWLHRADNDIHHYTGASRLAATAAATPGPWPIFAPDPAIHGDPRRAPVRLLRHSERELILQWLTAIDETDPAAIAHVLAQCDIKPTEREQVLILANAIQTPCKPPDERRTCRGAPTSANALYALLTSAETG